MSGSKEIIAIVSTELEAKLLQSVDQQAGLIKEMLAALRPFLPAYHAYVETMRNFLVEGETFAERRASEEERIDEAEERAFEALAKTLTFEMLAAVDAAIAKAEGNADAS